jgi:hypothetical protein
MHIYTILIRTMNSGRVLCFDSFFLYSPRVKMEKQMTNLGPRIGAARQIAARLTKRNADVASATRKRDVCLYRFFEAMLKLDKWLRNMGKPAEVRKVLNAPYDPNLPWHRNSAMLAIKLTYPTLAPKACSKYAAVLTFVRRRKKPGQSVRSFVQSHGGINRCVEKEKQSRPRQRRVGK